MILISSNNPFINSYIPPNSLASLNSICVIIKILEFIISFHVFFNFQCSNLCLTFTLKLVLIPPLLPSLHPQLFCNEISITHFPCQSCLLHYNESATINTSYDLLWSISFLAFSVFVNISGHVTCPSYSQHCFSFMFLVYATDVLLIAHYAVSLIDISSSFFSSACNFLTSLSLSTRE